MGHTYLHVLDYLRWLQSPYVTTKAIACVLYMLDREGLRQGQETYLQLLQCRLRLQEAATRLVSSSNFSGIFTCKCHQGSPVVRTKLSNHHRPRIKPEDGSGSCQDKRRNHDSNNIGNSGLRINGRIAGSLSGRHSEN